jgi:type IV secretion system protein VirB4
MSFSSFLDRHFGLSPFVPKSEADRDDDADLNATSELPFGLNPYHNDHTFRTVDDALGQIIRVQGLYSEMLDDDSIDIYKHQRNTALEAIADSNVGIYVHEVRRESNRWPAGTYRNWFAGYLALPPLRRHRRHARSRVQRVELFRGEQQARKQGTSGAGSG